MRAQEDGSAGKSMKQNTSGYLLALLAVVIWSGNFVVARAVADMIPPWQCNFWRWFTAFVTILPFAWRHLREDWPALRRHWRFVVVMSLLGVTLMNTFFYKAGQSTESLNMALIAPTAPIIILIFSRLLYGEAITPRRLLGMLVVATGIVILVSRGDRERLAALRFAPGDLWSLGGAASFGLYSLFMRHRGTDLSVFGFSAATFGLGALFCVPPVLAEMCWLPPVQWEPAVIIGVLYAGVGCSFCSFCLWTAAISRIGPVRAGIVYYSMPVFAATGAHIVLGEAVNTAQVVGGMLIIGGILIATLQRPHLPVRKENS